MKKWYESKTIWLNVISLIIEIGNMLMTTPVIPTQYTGILTVVVNVLNIVLRTLTNTTISK
jgi:hypothetical protein